MERVRGYIFDLDGVIVDTAKYHYLAWKSLADDLGFDFPEEHNEKLKGVSRMASLEVVLQVGGLSLTPEEKQELAERKNRRYVDYIRNLRKEELLPGAEAYLRRLKDLGRPTALGSASRNAPLILDGLGIRDLFDAVVDGNVVSTPKPDPEVFLAAARMLGKEPRDCIVFEDAAAGIQAAVNGGMTAVGVGLPENLPGARMWIRGLFEAPVDFD